MFGHNRKPTQLVQERKEHLKRLGMKEYQCRSWGKNWHNLKDGAKRKGRECTLTFEQYTELAALCGIFDSEMIGTRPGDFQMGRYKDEGGYTWGNCRFIPKEENLKERWKYAKRK